jgi:hypothetical protein
MQILAFGHRSGVGKDTCANLAVKLLRTEFNYRGEINIVGFADPLKLKCYNDFKEYGHLHPEEYESDRSKREILLKQIDMNVVDLWITIGNFYRAIHPQYWINDLLNNFKNRNGILLIKDLRYTNEAEAITSAGGKLVKVTNSRAKRINSVADDNMETFDFWDFLIENETDKVALMNKVRQVLTEGGYGS